MSDYKPDGKYQHQDDITLTEAGALQNQWYPMAVVVGQVKLIGIVFGVQNFNETIEVEVTIGNMVPVVTVQAGAVAGNLYNLRVHGNAYGPNTLNSAAGNTPIPRIDYEGAGMLIRMRKTTNAGVSDLRCRTIHELG